MPFPERGTQEINVPVMVFFVIEGQHFGVLACLFVYPSTEHLRRSMGLALCKVWR